MFLFASIKLPENKCRYKPAIARLILLSNQFEEKITLKMILKKLNKILVKPERILSHMLNAHTLDCSLCT